MSLVANVKETKVVPMTQFSNNHIGSFLWTYVNYDLFFYHCQAHPGTAMAAKVDGDEPEDTMMETAVDGDEPEDQSDILMEVHGQAS